MIETIELRNYQDLAECKSDTYQSKESFLAMSKTFYKGNVYGVVSDFGCGSWGIVTCLAGRGSSNYTGEIYVNGKFIIPSQLKKQACVVAERDFPDIVSKNSLTVKQTIEEALRISQLPYSVEEIKNIFGLTDARFERDINCISGEIWQVSLAVNYALGKDIFCYPWLSARDIFRFQVADELGILDFLRENNKIVFVPSSRKKLLKKYCDQTMVFDH